MRQSSLLAFGPTFIANASNIKRTALGGLIGVFVTLDAAAAGQLYTDRAAWEASAGTTGIEVIDFTKDDDGNPIPGGYQSALTLNGTTFPNVYYQTDGSLVTNGSEVHIAVQPGTVAFGTNLAPIYPLDAPSPKIYTITLSNGDQFTSTATTQTFSQDFRGVTASTPFEWVHISIQAGPMYFEDFRFYKASAPSTIKAIIDIRPDSAANPVNPKARGTLPVALLGSATLDVANVDTNSIRFGKNGTEVSAQSYNRYDVNADGRADLLLDFPNQGTGIAAGTTSAKLTGCTTSGVTFEGIDTLRVVRN